MRGTTWIAGVLAVIATVAVAADATDPTARARQELMDGIAGHMQVLGDMAGGKTAFDAAAAAAAKDGIIASAAQIPVRFEPPATDPRSKALPAIWTSFADFTARAAALGEAASALDPASLDGVRAGMRGVGGACQACHTAYRS